MDAVTKIPWRPGAKIRAIGPNPGMGGKRPPAEVEVVAVDAVREEYVTKAPGQPAPVITFEASARFWRLVQDGPMESLL